MKKLKLLWSVVAFCCFGMAASAQFTVSGIVKDSKGEPLIGASVAVKGTTVGTATDTDGKFSLSVPGQSGRLVVSSVGFNSFEINVQPGQESLTFALTESAASLDEVVVTGLASSIKRSNAANAVSTISAKELTGVTVQPTLDAALYGKLTGANISANSGAPGGGISVKLRGVTTFNGSSQPLYIVDGVYYDNSSFSPGLNNLSAASRGGAATSNQDNASNRIADLDPEDIEKIEVLKGASTAAIYGSRAAGGVVIITTKRGKKGAPVIEFSQSVGVASQLNKLGVRTFDDDKVKAAFGASEVAVFEAAKAAGKIYNYENELYGNNALQLTSRIGVSGGNDASQYYIGLTHKDDGGIVKNTGYQKTSVRLNLDQKVFSFMDFSANANYVVSSADRGYFNNDNTSTSIGVSYVSTPPWADLHPDSKGNYPDNPYAPANFLQTRDQLINNEKVNRMLLGGTLTTRLLTRDNQSLKLIARGGIDYYTLASTLIAPRTLQFEAGSNGTGGLSAYGTNVSHGSNVSAFMVYDYIIPNSVSFRTQAGVTQEDLDQNSVLSTATQLIGTQTNLNQAGSVQIDNTRINQVDKGFFAQEEVNFNDRVIGTVGVRGDKSSRNGDPNKLFYYPKASLALNVHKLLTLPQEISELKLRVAYGQSGNFPNFGATYNPLVAEKIGAATGSIIGSTRGNSTLGPERQTETEFGFDLGLLKNRIALDVTYYNKNVDDLILPTQIATSSGYTNYWKNAAAMSNKGFEIGLDALIFKNHDWQWQSRLAYWQNRATVTRLDVPAFLQGGFAPIFGVYKVELGKSPTQIIGLDAGNANTVLGDGEAKNYWSFTNAVTWRSFELNVLVHVKNGGNNVNLTTLLADLSGVTWDFDKISLDPEGKLGNGAYRVAQLGKTAKVFVEDASYVRIRELGLSYNLPSSIFNNKAKARIGVSARNYFNWFKYNSYDPEVSNFGINAINSNIEVTPFPSSKSINGTISVTF